MVNQARPERPENKDPRDALVSQDLLGPLENPVNQGQQESVDLLVNRDRADLMEAQVHAVLPDPWENRENRVHVDRKN